MKAISSLFAFASALLVNVVSAASSTQACDSSSGVCVAFSIPVSSSSSSSNSDILATVQAPGSLGWVAFGFGQQMTGSLMFVMWPYNNQVIISSRLGTGHVEPQVYDGPTISVISSAITSSQFTAQLRLSNSTTWSAGSLNIDSSDAPIIWAYGTNSPSNPSSPSSDFTQHRAEGQFSLNMKAAQVQEASPSTTTAEATASGTAVHSEAAGSSFSASTSTLATATTSISAPVITGVPIDYSDIGTGLTSYDKMVITHGVLMGLSFVILFPLGAIIIRFLSTILPVPTMLHYITQLTTFLLVLAAAAIGIYLSVGTQFIYFHQIFGIIIIALILLQGMLGWYHHHRFVRDKPSSRRWFTHLHLWAGRVIIVLGLVNCGFGLILANVATMYAIIWWAVTCALAVLYVGLSFWRQRSMAARRGQGESFGNAGGQGYSPQRYKQTEAYEMSRDTTPSRI